MLRTRAIESLPGRRVAHRASIIACYAERKRAPHPRNESRSPALRGSSQNYPNAAVCGPWRRDCRRQGHPPASGDPGSDSGICRHGTGGGRLAGSPDAPHGFTQAKPLCQGTQHWLAADLAAMTPDRASHDRSGHLPKFWHSCPHGCGDNDDHRRYPGAQGQDPSNRPVSR